MKIKFVQHIDFDRYVPLGRIGWRTCKNMILGVLSAWGCSLLCFLVKYFDARSYLFEHWDKTRVFVRPGAVMKPFYEILQGTMLLFGFAALCLLLLALWHYYYHFQDSRPIYLMRRLPDRWDLWRRCLALPLLGLAACIVLAVLNTLLFYAVYRFCTPQECLEPGQWRMLWESLTHQGGIYYAGN